MNEEDLEKTRALNELSDLVNEKMNETDDQIINIPDDINSEVNKEELFNDLTTNEDNNNQKKKKFSLKSIKQWWSKLSKKQKIIFISIAILILILIVTLIVILVTKKDNNNNETKTQDIILESDNYVYQNGVLTMLDKNGNAIGTYECKNKDEKKCYVAYLSNDEDEFDTPINKNSNDEVIKSRSLIYYDRYVFIFDNENENDLKISLYDMQDNKVLNEYYGVKSYNVENSNAVVLKDEKDTYGLFEFTSNGINPIIDFKYQYMGLIDKEKDDLVVVKDTKGYYLVDYTDKIKTKVFANPIIDYNENYIVIKDGNNYSVYNYTQELFNKNYDYIRLISNDYVAVVKNSKLFIRAYSDNKYNEEGYELTNNNFKKVYVFDDNKKLTDTLFAFDIELHDKILTITIKNSDNTTREEKLNLVEGDVSTKYDYYSYFNGKLYFYDDKEKTNLIGSYECNNKNNITADSLNNCYVAKDSVFNDSYINPYVEKNATIALYNKKYVFIMDAPDLQNDDNKEIKFYDLSQSKVLGTYSAIDANMEQSVLSLTHISTNDAKIIARQKSGKFGVIKIDKDKASVLYKFDYIYIERAGNDYIVELDNQKWQIIYGSNSYTSSEFDGRIKNYANSHVVTRKNDKDYIYKSDASDLKGADFNNTGYDYIDINNKNVFGVVSNNKLSVYKYDGTKAYKDEIPLKSDKYYNTNTPAFRISQDGSSVSVYNSDGTLDHEYSLINSQQNDQMPNNEGDN